MVRRDDELPCRESEVTRIPFPLHTKTGGGHSLGLRTLQFRRPRRGVEQRSGDLGHGILVELLRRSSCTSSSGSGGRIELGARGGVPRGCFSSDVAAGADSPVPSEQVEA